jgi:hypothetical protein
MQLIEAKSASPEQQVQHFAALILNNLEASALFLTEALAGKQLDDDHPLFKLTVNALDQFKASGLARSNIDVEIMSFIMLGTIASLVMLSRARSGANVEAMAERYSGEFVRILRGGIFVDAAQQAAAKPARPVIQKKRGTK